GEPIWPIEEKPVPKGDTPGEWYSPTQPFPTKPKPYDGTGLSVDDLINFTPELRAEAERIVSKYRLGPMFTPPSVSRAEGPIATLTMGAQAAATNWPGGSFDPELHTVFVASQTSVATAGLVPPPPGVAEVKYFQGTVLSGARLTGGSGSGAGAATPAGASAPGGRAIIAPARGAAPAAAAADGRGSAPAAAPGGGRGGRGGGGAAEGGEGGGGGGLTVQGLPLIRPPYSRITAINLDTGDFRWQVPFGATPDNIR